MGYRFQVDRSNCLNCGVCMDVCPVQALDMTRTAAPVIEERIGHGSQVDRRWMMEFPVQTGECIGCNVCQVECPTAVISVEAVQGRVDLEPAQGPIHHGPDSVQGWMPLSLLTTESLKEVRSDPFGRFAAWRSTRRSDPWQVWKTWGDREEATERLVAPCQEACPVGTDAGLYVSLVAEGRYAEALKVASEYNPFPSVCGRVCTAPCEVACRRGVVDEPISIRELKRYAADHGIEGYPTIRTLPETRPERVAIVGAGPTGLAAAYMLVRGGYRVTVFDAMPVAGGMMAIGIPEYRLPKELLQAEIARVVSLGVELRLNAALGPDFSLEDLKKEGFTAILIATGASKSQPLGVPGEELHGVWPATVFLKKVNLGERVDLHGPALVVGGGSTAMDAARSAWRAGASSVRVLYRRTMGDMPAQAEELRAALHEGVVVEELVSPVEVVGRQGRLIEVRCQRFEVVGRGVDGRSKIAAMPGSAFTIPAQTLLVAIGEAPDPSILPPGSSIEVGDWGGLLTDPETLMTAQAGVFAAGDVATGPKSVIEGVAQGQRAAWAIDRYLRKLPVTRYVPSWRQREARVNTASRVEIEFAYRKRAEVELTSPDGESKEARNREVSMGLDEVDARREAKRCLRCDAIAACPVVRVKREVTA